MTFTNRWLRTALPVVVALCAAAPPAWGINGHFLHGVGARNSAMGGAGVGLPTDTLTALNSNPALLAGLDGQNFQFGFELIDGQPEIEGAVPTPVGPFRGASGHDGNPSPLPAFGWSRKSADGRLAYGMGGLALAGYSSDHAQDFGNPLLLPQPIGFGRVSSEFQYLKLPFALAYQVTPRLALGGSVFVGYARLSSSPAGFAAPDCNGPTSCYYPAATQEDSFGVGVQVGAYYELSPTWSLGASYTSEQALDDFEFNSTVANPNLPTFGTARRFSLAVDMPAQAAIGLGWQPRSDLSIALDGKWIGYEGTAGFGTSGFAPDGAIRGFGWQDITVVGVGVEYRPGRWALRAGFNHSDSPIEPALAAFSFPAPAVFEDHATLGLGYRVDDSWTLDVAYYRAFEGEVTGPLVSPAGPIPGTEVTLRNQSDSLLATFSFGVD